MWLSERGHPWDRSPGSLHFWRFQPLAVPSHSCPAPVLVILKKVLPNIAMFQQMKCINFLDPDPLHIPGLLFCEQSADSLNSSSEEQMLRKKTPNNPKSAQRQPQNTLKRKARMEILDKIHGKASPTVLKLLVKSQLSFQSSSM